MMEVVKVLLGPSLAAEMHLHDSTQKVKVWSAIKEACERGLLVYASTGTERGIKDKLSGRVLLIENVLEFKLSGEQKKE